jgi:hypothetical protein
MIGYLRRGRAAVVAERGCASGATEVLGLPCHVSCLQTVQYFNSFDTEVPINSR